MKRPAMPKRVLIELCVALVASVVAWLVLARPAAERLEAVRAELQAQRERLARLSAEDREGPDPSIEIISSREERQRLGRLLRQSGGSVEDAAVRAGVRSAEREGEVVGGYDQVIGYIREIEQRMGASVVERVEVEAQGPGKVRATIDANHAGGLRRPADGAGGSP